MKALRQLYWHLRVMASGRRHRFDLIKALARRPQLLFATAGYELATGLSARVEPRLKTLANSKVAAIVACEYCLDIGGAIAPGEGISERQLLELARYRTSEAFDDEERLVLDLAVAMTEVPVVISDDLRSRLTDHFSSTQVAELTSSIAWENHRARLNTALDVRASGFADGMVCALPEPSRQ